MSDERILEVSQAARILKVSPATVGRMCEARLLPGAFDVGTRTRRHWRIPESALKAVNPTPELGHEEAIAKEEAAEAKRIAAEKAAEKPASTGNTSPGRKV